MATLATHQTCHVCGVPVDAEYFDIHGFIGQVEGEPVLQTAATAQLDGPRALPRRGEQKVMATFQLHAQYCGAILNFWQYTDLYGRDPAQIQTPGFEWLILQNGKPVFPYTALNLILNPWGYNCCPVFIRLDENARVDFAIRNRSVSDDALSQYPIKAFAGRIQGRYWYNDVFGRRLRT